MLINFQWNHSVLSFGSKLNYLVILFDLHPEQPEFFVAQIQRSDGNIPQSFLVRVAADLSAVTTSRVSFL